MAEFTLPEDASDLGTGAPVTTGELLDAIETLVGRQRNESTKWFDPEGQVAELAGKREVFIETPDGKSYWVAGVRVLPPGNGSLSGAIEILVNDGDAEQQRRHDVERLEAEVQALALFLAGRTNQLLPGNVWPTNDVHNRYFNTARRLYAERPELRELIANGPKL